MSAKKEDVLAGDDDIGDGTCYDRSSHIDPDERAKELAKRSRQEARERLIAAVSKRTINERLCTCKFIGTRGGDWRHLKACPRSLADEQLKEMVRPIAEEIAELELAKAESQAKGAGVEGHEQVYVPFNNLFVWFPTPNEPNVISDTWRNILCSVARGMNGRLIWRNQWRSVSYGATRPIHAPTGQEPLAVPLTEENPDFGKKGHAGEGRTLEVVLGGRDIEWYAVFPSERHAREFVAVARQLEMLLKVLHDAGRTHGTSLIAQLAAGKMTWGEFEAETARASGGRD